MAQLGMMSTSGHVPSGGDSDPLCALCLAPATQQSPSAAGVLSAPDQSGQRTWSPLPDIDACDGCLTLLIRDRASVGWCLPGSHWGPENAECQLHASWFETPSA